MRKYFFGTHVAMWLIGLFCFEMSALAGPPAELPTSVIREIDGSYTIMTRPTTDGKDPTISVDQVSRVDVFTRNAEGSLASGFQPEYDRMVAGNRLASPPVQVVLCEDGWKVKNGSSVQPAAIVALNRQLPRIFFLPCSFAEYTLSTDANKWQGEYQRRRAERPFIERGLPVELVFESGVPTSMIDVALRVEDRWATYLPVDTPRHSIPLYGAALGGGAGAVTDYIGVLPFSYLGGNFALATKALFEAENNEADMYLEMYTASAAYSWIGDGMGNPITSSTVIHSGWFPALVLEDSLPQYGTVVSITVENSSRIVWDTFRFDGIDIGKNDLESALMHETVHALGFFDFPTPVNIQEGGITHFGLYRMSNTNRFEGLFGTARRLSGTLPSWMVPRYSVAYQMFAGNGTHWADTDDLFQAIGIMIPTQYGGDLLPHLFYLSDQRAIDILGYNFEPVSTGSLPSPLLLEPLDLETDVPLGPVLSWTPSTEPNTKNVVALYNASTRTEESRIFTSPLILAAQYSIPTGVLAANTQYWWSVTTVLRSGGFSTSNLRSFTTAGGANCDSIDFNNDTSFFDPQDIAAFESVYSEGPCIPATATCNDIDFNNDGSIFDPCDINSFLLMYSEGPCTPCGV